MDLTALVEIEAIKRLKYRYMRCLDQKGWDEMAECFVPDATASYGGGAYVFAGRDEILAFLRRTMGAETVLSSHRVHQPEIALGGPERPSEREMGPDTATATWAFDDVVVDEGLGVTIRGAGFYEDEYVKVDGTWRIRATGYRRSFEEIQRRDGVRLTASWWGTNGRSTLPA